MEATTVADESATLTKIITTTKPKIDSLNNNNNINININKNKNNNNQLITDRNLSHPIVFHKQYQAQPSLPSPSQQQQQQQQQQQRQQTSYETINNESQNYAKNSSSSKPNKSSSSNNTKNNKQQPHNHTTHVSSSSTFSCNYDEISANDCHESNNNNNNNKNKNNGTIELNNQVNCFRKIQITNTFCNENNIDDDEDDEEIASCNNKQQHHRHHQDTRRTSHAPYRSHSQHQYEEKTSALSGPTETSNASSSRAANAKVSAAAAGAAANNSTIQPQQQQQQHPLSNGSNGFHDEDTKDYDNGESETTTIALIATLVDERPRLSREPTTFDLITNLTSTKNKNKQHKINNNQQTTTNDNNTTPTSNSISQMKHSTRSGGGGGGGGATESQHQQQLQQSTFLRVDPLTNGHIATRSPIAVVKKNPQSPSSSSSSSSSSHMNGHNNDHAPHGGQKVGDLWISEVDDELEHHNMSHGRQQQQQSVKTVKAAAVDDDWNDARQPRFIAQRGMVKSSPVSPLHSPLPPQKQHQQQQQSQVSHASDDMTTLATKYPILVEQAIRSATNIANSQHLHIGNHLQTSVYDDEDANYDGGGGGGGGHGDGDGGDMVELADEDKSVPSGSLPPPPSYLSRDRMLEGGGGGGENGVSVMSGAGFKTSLRFDANDDIDNENDNEASHQNWTHRGTC